MSKIFITLLLLIGLIEIYQCKEEKQEVIVTEITITKTKSKERKNNTEINEIKEDKNQIANESEIKNGTESEEEEETQEPKPKPKEKEEEKIEEKKKEEEKKIEEEEQTDEPTSEPTSEPKSEQKEQIIEEEEEEQYEELEEQKVVRDALLDRKKPISPDKYLTLKAPYQNNEDFVISAIAFGQKDNLLPLQIETTSYKTWVPSSKDNKKYFYDKDKSESHEEPGEWDTIIDEEGVISGNIIYDKAYLGKFEINHFKFIEAIEYDDNFNDFKNGKLGLGNCQYAENNDLEYCLLQRLKDNGSINQKIFSLKELSHTHGEVVIGDFSSTSKGKDFPWLPVVDKETYADIEDDEFKMGWLTEISHVLFSNNTDNVNDLFDNNIYIEKGLASFDSSCHYIEAPYMYIVEFDKLFQKYYPNVCRKVNNNGVYMFLCKKDRFELVKDTKINLIFVMKGNGFKIPMESLFENTIKGDYEFFVHFKDFEQNIWNFGHPFFHYFTMIFDQDNQKIGIDGENVLELSALTENALSKKKSCLKKIIIAAVCGLILLAVIFYFCRKLGITKRLNNGVDPKLIDEESKTDILGN